MKNFNGKALFLDRSDINTDEIIPAKYLTEVSKKALKPYLLEDLNLEGFNPQSDMRGKSVIITRSNFGCGSSREHAPWALEVNGFFLVIAQSFARIFRQNMFNCGMLAAELSDKTIDYIFNTFSQKETFVETVIEKKEFIIKAENLIEKVNFTLSDFDFSLLKAGGWIEYADSKY